MDNHKMDVCFGKFTNNSAGRLLIVGFSPTGGGHTARLLNIIEMALVKKSIPAGSIVLFHLPCRWEGNPRSALISDLSLKLSGQHIHVLMAESDKSIYGYLDPKTGGSDDASILQRVARFPLRNPGQHAKTASTVDDFVIFRNKGDDENLPVISAKKLMESVATTFGKKVLAERCYVLTDMDPYLQKAAINKGVPGFRCLDQQNHAILLDLKRADLNLLPKYALLSKVLGGYGETISHIDLGGRNTLNSVISIAAQLNIDDQTSKIQAREKVADLLLSYALSDSQINAKLAEKGKPFSGVIAGPQIKNCRGARNIIYIYAHKKTNMIADCVAQKVFEGDSAFQNVIFLFCGSGAVGSFNAMHLAYIADADGVTTAGAGTVGEYAFLRKHAQCASRLLILPIEGHNEQERNADVLSQDNAIRDFITRALNKETLSVAIERFVRGQPKTGHAPGTMSEFINAVSDSNSYVKQAYDLLFTDASTVNFKNITEVERLMNKNSLLRATRRYLKLIFQALDETDKRVQGTINVSLKQGEKITFSDVNDLVRKLHNPISLGNIIGLKHPTEARHLPLLDNVQRHFSAIASGQRSCSAGLKEAFGEFMVTGF